MVSVMCGNAMAQNTKPLQKKIAEMNGSRSPQDNGPGKFTTVDDIRAIKFYEGAKVGNHALSDRDLDELHSFLSKKNLKPHWPSTRELRKAFGKISYTKLVSKMAPETSVREFCMSLRPIYEAVKYAKTESGQIAKLDEQLTLLGCTNVRDILRLPWVKTHEIDVSDNCMRAFVNFAKAIDEAFKNTGQDIYNSERL